jgi:hypothetical protein
VTLNHDRIGHHYPSYRYEVSREKIREYALATGVRDEAYQRDHGDIVAPPTFAACFTVTQGVQRLLEDPNLGAHPRLVHGKQAYEFHRTVKLGDILECTAEITDLTTRRRNDFLTLQIDCVDARSGELVVTSRATFVFLGPEQD